MFAFCKMKLLITQWLWEIDVNEKHSKVGCGCTNICREMYCKLLQSYTVMVTFIYNTYMR